MKTTLAIAAAALVLALTTTGCSHAPHAPQDAAVAESLSDRLKNTLVRELESRRDLKKIETVNIYQVEPERDDAYRLSYRVSFVSDSDPYGEVGHDFEGTAVIVKASDDDWKVEHLERKSQSLNFHQPATSLIEKKKSSLKSSPENSLERSKDD